MSRFLTRAPKIEDFVFLHVFCLKLDFPSGTKVSWTLREFSRVRSNYASEVFQDTIETFPDTLGDIPSWTPAEFSRTLTEFDQNMATALTYVTSTRLKTSKVGFSMWAKSLLNSARVQQSSIELCLGSVPRHHRNISWYIWKHSKLNSGRVQPNSNRVRPKTNPNRRVQLVGN